MMSYRSLIIGAFILIICFGMYRSHKLLKQKERLERAVKNDYGPMQILGEVTYQGGFPLMPKPAHLNIGLTDSDLVLFDQRGGSGRIQYERFRKIDKFTIQKAKKHRYSLMAWGPLALVLNKTNFQHFIVVKYWDANNERNNLLIQVKTGDTRDKYFESIRRNFKPMNNRSESAVNE